MGQVCLTRDQIWVKFGQVGPQGKTIGSIWVGLVGFIIKSDSKRKAQNYIQNFVSKKFRKQFYFLTYILPDFVFHESLKEFWQNSYFENMRAGFLKGVNFHFDKLALK